MHSAQPPIHWGGAVMWRGTTWAKPIRTGSSFIGLGTHRQRIVFYPISRPEPRTGLAMINWIAEVTMDNAEGWKQSGWFRQASVGDFVHYFTSWIWDWLDVPALIKQAEIVFENPMIDRDPVPTWRDGPVVLLGDAAHAMYPTGSNGGSQAIVDARRSGGRHGRAWGRRRKRLPPMTRSYAALSRNSSCATAAPGRSGSSISSMNVAAVHSTTSTMSSRPRSVPNSWRPTRPPRALPLKSSTQAPQTIPNGVHVPTARAASGA